MYYFLLFLLLWLSHFPFDINFLLSLFVLIICKSQGLRNTRQKHIIHLSQIDWTRCRKKTTTGRAWRKTSKKTRSRRKEKRKRSCQTCEANRERSKDERTLPRHCMILWRYGPMGVLSISKRTQLTTISQLYKKRYSLFMNNTRI